MELIDGRIYSRYEGKPRLFNVDEYYAMADAGILAPEERVELIDGEIIPMSPMKSAHAASVDSLDYELTSQLGRRARVRAQIPVRLNGVTEPEPDIAVVRWRDDFYAHAHPGPEDVHLDNRGLRLHSLSGPERKTATVRPLRNPGNLDSEYPVSAMSKSMTEPADGEYQRSRIFGIDETLTLSGLRGYIAAGQPDISPGLAHSDNAHPPRPATPTTPTHGIHGRPRRRRIRVRAHPGRLRHLS